MLPARSIGASAPYDRAVDVLELTGDGLRIEDVVAVARGGRGVRISQAGHDRLAAAAEVARRNAEDGAAVYGLTTGLGALRKVAVDGPDAARHARVSMHSHRAAHGAALPPEVVRAAMLHRANAFACGFAMVRPEVADAFVEALNADDLPIVHEIGSVGQSDLPAMAEIGSHLVDRGLELRQGETLAVLNANSLTAGHAALAAHDLTRLLDTFDDVLAATYEGFRANLSVLHPAVGEARPYAGLAESLGRLRAALAGSDLWHPAAPRHLQDPLSFRAAPQTHGAARDALTFARGQIETELNASGDNPMVVVGEGRLVSVGNFDIRPVALAIDLARIALASVVTLSCERVQKHLDDRHSGLPTGLRADESPDEALQIVGVGAASLAAEVRMLAAPVSYEVPTSGIANGIEDNITMAPLGVRRLATMVQLGFRMAAVELVVACQAIDLRGELALGAGVGPLHRCTRELVPFTGAGEAPAGDLDGLAARLGGTEGSDP
jgi:histidine ammonia-lyase